MEEISVKYKIPLVKLPSDYQPRAAFPILFSALCGIILSLFPDRNFIEKDIDLLITHIRDQNRYLNPNSLKESNIAKKLALKWLDKIPLF